MPRARPREVSSVRLPRSGVDRRGAVAAARAGRRRARPRGRPEPRAADEGSRVVEADARRRRQPRPRPRRHRGAGDGSLVVGALTRQQALLDSSVAGAIAAAARMPRGRFAGYRATRHRGTVGGSLAYAAPWAELTAAVVALDAEIEIRSARGDRTVAARAFFRGAARDGARARRAAHRGADPGRRTAHGRRLSRGQRALPGLRPGRGSRDRHARRGGNVHRGRARPPPRCAGAASRGRRPPRRDHDRRRRVRGGRGVAVGARPADDIEVSGTYRRRVAATLALRALRDANEKARGDDMSDRLEVRVEVNGAWREGSSSRAGRWPTSCARISTSPARTSPARTASAGTATSSSTARPSARA